MGKYLGCISVELTQRVAGGEWVSNLQGVRAVTFVAVYAYIAETLLG